MGKILNIIKRNFQGIFGGVWGYTKKVFRTQNFFHYDNLLATVLVFFFFWLFGVIADQVKILDPLGEAFSDVELTDVMFSQMGKNANFREENALSSGNKITKVNQDVVIINIGNKSRPEMAIMIDTINACHPKVIGVDAFYRSIKDFPTDALLAEALTNVDNLVLVSEAKNHNIELNYCDSLTGSFEMFLINAQTGCATKPIEDKNNDVLRTFIPFFKVKNTDSIEPAFSVKLCEAYRPSSTEKLKKRGNIYERINYVGNIHIPGYESIYANQTNMAPLENCEHFLAYDCDDILSGNFDHSQLKGRIVLMGFIGSPIYTSEGEDKFYTPLNKKYIGKTNKDMYGVVTHANIIAMILNNNYIDEMPDWTIHLTGVLVVFFTMASFRPLYYDYKIWYDGVSKVLGFGYTFAILFIIGIVFEYSNYELKFGSIYFACILLAGDFLEIYYGFLKNLFQGKHLS